MKNRITFRDNWGYIEVLVDGVQEKDPKSIKKVRIHGKNYKTFLTDNSEYVSDHGHGAWVRSSVLTVKEKVFGRLRNFQLHTLPSTTKIEKV